MGLDADFPDRASFAWDDVVMVTGLTNRTDLNDSAARVLRDEPRADGRIPIEMFLGMERVWIKRANLLGPIPDAAALTHEPYSRMSDVERTDVGMFFFANQNSTRIPGVRGRSVSLVDRAPVTFCDSVPDPAPAPATRAPAPVDRRASARAALQKMAAEHCPRPHYCIYCGSEGPVASKCAPCGFYRGTFCFPPKGGDTFMGRKLAFVKWPWTGDPDAPYVRAGAAADVAPPAAPEPKSKYAVDPPPVRAMTRDEALGPNPCAEVCPKYPQSTAARLVAYVLGKVDYITPGVESDFRYYLQTNEDWRKTRERIIKIHEAGEENAAEVMHEEYLVGHHKVCQTEENRPAYLPADWDGMKRRVKARQRKDAGPGALAYPDSDADEDEVAAYLEAKVRQLDAGAAPAPAPTNPKPERKDDPLGVAAFFEQLRKDLPFYYHVEMGELAYWETIRDFEVGKVIDGPNSYEKSLTVALTKTPRADTDDESQDEDDDADQASVPVERTTKTITLKTYKTPHDDNNAGVWVVDETGYERELHRVGTIPCPGGEPVRSVNQARPDQCAQDVVEYLVHDHRWWEEY